MIQEIAHSAGRGLYGCAVFLCTVYSVPWSRYHDWQNWRDGIYTFWIKNFWYISDKLTFFSSNIIMFIYSLPQEDVVRRGEEYGSGSALMGRGLRRNIYNVGVNGSRQLLKILPDKGIRLSEKAWIYVCNTRPGRVPHRKYEWDAAGDLRTGRKADCECPLYKW